MLFPRDLGKTNLAIVPTTPDNPFEWAGRILFGNSPCSGGVVALPGYRPGDKAIVLTAGHCIRKPNGSQLSPKEVLSNVPLKGEASFSFPRSRKVRGADGEIRNVQNVWFAKIIFASFDVVDLALLEMNETYEQLQYGNMKPPMLARQAYVRGQSLTSFGVPASFYQSTQFHMSKCESKSLFTLHSSYGNAEDDSAFDMTRRVSMNCTVFAGMSGGYVRNPSGEVIGVNSGGMNDYYSFFASVAPIANCVSKDGRLVEMCLSNLKTRIEQWKGKPNKDVAEKVEIKPSSNSFVRINIPGNKEAFDIQGVESTMTPSIDEVSDDLVAPIIYIKDVTTIEPGSIEGKIVLTDRGGIPFSEKIAKINA
ncbi:MAG: hypothetical protein EOP04_30235, partial [Proteobacteria bacterium]